MSHEASTWVWAQNLPPGAKLVLLAIADHADKTGFCWPGAEGLSDKCKVSERTVWRQISELEKMGTLCRTRRSSQSGRRSNSYQIHIGLDCQFCNMTKSVPQPDTHGVSNVTSMAYESPIESSEEPSNNIERQVPLDSDTWPDWYSDLYSIPGFKKTLGDCWMWLGNHPFSQDKCNSTAAAIKARWGGKGWKYKDVWAVFRAWVQRPDLQNTVAPAPSGRPTRPSGGHTAEEMKESLERSRRQ